MDKIICKHCGHELAAGSKFCNQCGTKVVADDTMLCPNCNSTIPAQSVFCPECGERLGAPKAAPVPPQQVPVKKDLDTLKEEIEKVKAEEKKKQEKSEAKKSVIPPFVMRKRVDDDEFDEDDDYDDDDDDDDDDDEEYEVVERHRARNIIVAIIILALIALFAVSRWGDSDKNKEDVQNAEVVASNQDSENTMRKVLQDELNSTGCDIAYAMKFDKTENSPERIVGVVYNNRESHWYYRIYELTKNGNNWAYDMKVQESVEHGVTFDRSRMDADEAKIPQAIDVDGKRYFFYAYMKQSSSTEPAVVTLNLYDPDNGKIAETLEYSGQMTQRDGKQVIVSDPKANGRQLREAMENHARNNIGVLHIKTPDEIEDEKAKEEEEREKEEAEREANSTDWDHNNAEAVSQLHNGQEATLNMNSEGSKTEPPQDLKGNIAETKNGNTFTVFRTNNGKVYAYNKNTEKYLKVVNSGAKSISFQSSEPGVIYIGTSNGKLRVNLNSGQAKIVSDNPDKETKSSSDKPADKPAEGEATN